MVAVLLPVFVVSPTTFWLLTIAVTAVILASGSSLRHR